MLVTEGRPPQTWFLAELALFVSALDQSHWQVLNHQLRYRKGTSELSLRYSKPKISGLMDRPNVQWVFVDSDWAGRPDSRSSTSGYALMLNGAAVAWKSKRQSACSCSV